MQFEQFDQLARQDDALTSLIQDVGGDIGARMPSDGPRTYAAGVDDAIIALAAYALFRYVKDRMDHQRNVDETEIAERRVRIIGTLVADGFEPEQAAKVTESVFKQIGKRADDDPALKKALSLIGGS